MISPDPIGTGGRESPNTRNIGPHVLNSHLQTVGIVDVHNWRWVRRIKAGIDAREDDTTGRQGLELGEPEDTLPHLANHTVIPSQQRGNVVASNRVQERHLLSVPAAVGAGERSPGNG